MSRPRLRDLLFYQPGRLFSFQMRREDRENRQASRTAKIDPLMAAFNAIAATAVNP